MLSSGNGEIGNVQKFNLENGRDIQVLRNAIGVGTVYGSAQISIMKVDGPTTL